MTGPTCLKRALVVDDSDVMRGFMRFLLEAEGYEVNEVATVADALALQPASYDLLVIDVHLRGGRGTDIVDVLRSRDPRLLERCILVTGDTVDKLPKDVTVMQKPVAVKIFINTVRRVKSRQQPA